MIRERIPAAVPRICERRRNSRVVPAAWAAPCPCPNKEKGEGLGRALIRQRNKAAAAAKERGEALAFGRRRGATSLESVIDVRDIDAVLQRAAEADQLAEAASVSSDSDLVTDLRALDSCPPSSSMGIMKSRLFLYWWCEIYVFSCCGFLRIGLVGARDATGETEEERRRLRKEQEALHASSLRVPRRPPWHSQMTVEELDANERQAFLVWRRNLARLEENDKLVLTPFEKNIDIWRQLWRVLERSDLLAVVVDVRDPLFCRCPDLWICRDKRINVLLQPNSCVMEGLTLGRLRGNHFAIILRSPCYL